MKALAKFCTYAPWSVRVCLNGHMWLRQHLRRSGHYVEPLDNGIAGVDDPAALARLCRRFGPQHIQRFFDRWMYRLPNPFTAQDRRAGCTYQLSILQLEVARTEVFDRPLHGRRFFEEVIRQHLDLGRPQRLQLVFDRRFPRRRGQLAARTRVLTQDVDSHVFCRGLARLEPDYPVGDLNQAWRAFEAQLAALTVEARLAA